MGSQLYIYIANCSETIVQSEQVKIDKDIYGANVEATAEDIKDLKFNKGLLVASKPHLVLYLKSIGFYSNLDKKYVTNQAALYKVHNPIQDIENNDVLSLKTLDALQKYRGLKVEEQKAVLVKYFGAAYQLPEDKRLITTAINESNAATNENQKFLDVILDFGEDIKEDTTNKGREEIELLVSLLLNNKTIDIDTDTTVVTIKGKDGKTPIKLYTFDEGIERDARVVLLVDWLGLKDGAKTLEVLKKQNKN
jgi:hypothetical protein